METKALLVVSFGTSYADTREKTIGALEAALASAFPDRRFYRAWTSGLIRRKIRKDTGEAIDSVEEALERMSADGVTDVLVQTTHMLPGEEFELLRSALAGAAGRFAAVSFGAPLLDAPGDAEALARAVEASFPDVGENEMLCLMGHGSEALKTNVYLSLNERFAAHGRDNIVVGTVEFDPGFAPVLERIRRREPDRVYLAPLMVVAGDHANNDMAGDEPDSWKSMVEAAGFPTVCVVRGMGEYPAVRELYVRHARAAAPFCP